LACERFSGFVAGEPEPRWRRFPCAPNRARYEALLASVLPYGNDA
jgi:hypothetical protein